jgi:hypothetical protein
MLLSLGGLSRQRVIKRVIKTSFWRISDAIRPLDSINLPAAAQDA